MGPIGYQEILVILLILVIIFGAKRLPHLGKGLGEALRNFKKSVRGDEDESEESVKEKRSIENGPGESD